MNLDRTWVKVGGITGILTAVLYISAKVVFLPGMLGHLRFFSLGLLTIITIVGLYHLLKRHRTSVPLQLGTLFAIIGGLALNFMAVVQRSIVVYMRKYFNEAADETTKETIRWVWKGLDSVQLGLDVSFDIFLLTGIVLISISMLSHPRFGPFFGLTGIILAVATLALNLYTFPVPPGEAPGIGIDLGPLVGVWSIAFSIQMLRSLGWLDQQTQTELVSSPNEG